MEARNTTFQQLISGPKQFMIPVFQRDYKWREDNWQKLWEDVVRSDNAGHFMGSIVHTPDTAFAAIPRYLVIDGQQRLATLTVLLAAFRDHVSTTGWHDDGTGPTAKQIDDYYIKNTHETGNYKYKLLLRRKDNEILRSILDGHTPPATTGTQRSLVDEAYSYFCERLGEQNTDLGVVYRGVIGLRVVEMTLDPHIDNPQSVFESMNSTGVDLSQGDLVRNYLLMGLQEAEQTRLYEQYWHKIELQFRRHDSALDSFVRDYVALKRADVKQARADQIYDEFKRFLQSESAPQDLEHLLSEMVRFAGYYAVFRGFVAGPTKEISEAMSDVRYHGDTGALLIMRLFDCYSNGILERHDFVEALETIESYLMRRAVVRAQTRSHWNIFASLATKVEHQATLESLLFSFEQLPGSQAFPTDSAFRRSLEEGELYRTRACKQLLARLENHESDEPSPTAAYSIEHIMPQNQNLRPKWQEMLGEDWREVHERWCHRLGNLTLTGYNARYSDRPFEEKKTISGGFNESAVRLNNYVRGQNEWTETNMKVRGQLLTNRSLQIWKYPQPTQEYVTARRERRLQEEAQRTDVDQLSMSRIARNLFDPLHREILDLGDHISVVRERNSLCYYTSDFNFFLELLPRNRYLMLLMEEDISEMSGPSWLLQDGTEWKFIPNSSFNHRHGVVVEMWQSGWIAEVMPVIRQAYDLSVD